MSTTTEKETVEVKVAVKKPQNDKKKKVMMIVGTLAAIGLIYFIYDYIFYVSTDNAQIGANTVILTSRVSGYVTQVNVEEGQKVKAGDVLVQIDSKDYQNRTKQSENELGSVTARVQDAEKNYHRIQSLFEQGAVSAQQRDSALATYQELARRQKALQAQADISSNSLNDTQLRAPSDGTIAKKAAEVGMLANPGTPLVAFVSDESRWVVANFKETDLTRLKVGQPVDVDVDAISGRSFEGEIESFYPATGSIFSLIPFDNATGNFTKVVQRVPTRIKLKNLKKEDIELLKAGLSVEVAVKVH
jgi:membrane fusion protein (multidrug efflux system)